MNTQKTVTLEILECKTNLGIDQLSMHENIVKLLNNYRQFEKSKLEIYPKARRTSDSHKYLTIEEINNAVVVFISALHLNNGSGGDVDLYQLLQKYLLDSDKRKQMNAI